jgi:NAD(P)-dependent dehydrogenase (short-subunit alcohol dehydrogenase family)
VPSQEGRVAIVTGASSGIGLWTAAGLAGAGAHVALVCRDARRGEDAQRFIAGKSGRTPDLIVADFSDLKQVRAAASAMLARYPAIHILVNNAGLLSPKPMLTRDGYEMTFAVNHLAPFLLTDMLMPALVNAGEPGRHARIVNVASAASKRAAFDLTDLMSARGYSAWRAYANSKLANILFTKQLARLLPPRPVSANCLHPGVVGTRFGESKGALGLVWPLAKLFLISPEQGAVNSLYVATAPEIEGTAGAYFVKQKAVQANPVADDPALAEGLWSESAKLVAAALAR